jgi:hypothetical protein
VLDRLMAVEAGMRHLRSELLNTKAFLTSDAARPREGEWQCP